MTPSGSLPSVCAKFSWISFTILLNGIYFATMAKEIDAAATLGLIKGLTEVVQQQNQAMKNTSDQIKQLATTVENLTKVQPQPLPQSRPQPQSRGLRLSNLVSPEFTGKEPRDRFLERIQILLVTSNVPLQCWLTFVKQQCQKESRAFNTLTWAQEKHVKLIGEDVAKAGPTEYNAHCIETLKEKRGLPKDQQIHELLETYYTMKQNPRESVADFAHRFCETQHNLDKLIPKIHSELELLYAFVIKLRPDISRDLLREFANFKTSHSL